jgi:chemotaxis protein CheX
MDTTANETGSPAVEGLSYVAESAVGILNATCGVQLKSQQDDGTLSDDGAIIAFISLVGDVEWSIFLGLTRQSACALAERFAGFEIPFESDDMGDAIGELSNILAGEVKARLDKKAAKVEISLPSVIRAESLCVLKQRGVSMSKACFDSSMGTLWTGLITQDDGAAMQ